MVIGSASYFGGRSLGDKIFDSSRTSAVSKHPGVANNYQNFWRFMQISVLPAWSEHDELCIPVEAFSRVGVIVGC